MSKIEGAGYPDSSFSEDESIAILKSILLSHYRKFKAYLSENDKTPNTDGKIEVLEESKTQYGALDVQVKTLEKGKAEISYSVKLKLLAYIRDSAQIPFILIVVDHDDKKAYWKHIDSDLAYVLIQKAIDRDRSKNKKATGDSTITVKFEKNNELSVNGIWDDWKTLINEFKSRIQEYPKLKEEYNKIKSHNDHLMNKNGDHSLSIDHEYIDINKFLESLNSLINKEFSIIKSIYRTDFWRFGIDILNYKDQHLSYSLKFMMWSENLAQIRVLKVEDEEKLREYIPNSFFFRAISGINPVRINPKKYAYELSYDLFKYALKNEVFWFDNEILKKEYISMIHATKGFAGTAQDEFFSLELLRNEINKVFVKIPREKERMEAFPEARYNLIRALDYIQDFQLKGVSQLETRTGAMNSLQSVLYNALTYTEFSEKSDGIIFSFWSRFLDAYDSVCDTYFPELKDELRYHDGFNCEVLVPIIHKTVLDNGNSLNHVFLLVYNLDVIPEGYIDNVIIRSDLADKSNVSTLPFINFNDIDYPVVGWRTIRLSELTKSDLPIRANVLDLLDKKIGDIITEIK